MHGPKDSVTNNISAAKWMDVFKQLYTTSTENVHIPKPNNDPSLQSNVRTLPDSPNLEPIATVSSLDHDITENEVSAALAKLHSHKAPGIDGITSEMLVAAGDILATPLSYLFNQMFDRQFPDCLSTGFIHPIFKKGDPNDPLNYRGITICSTISKLYASILDNRIHEWAESEGIRAHGQAGFRRNRGTLDNIFILRTLLDQRQHLTRNHPSHKTQKLFTCFVDFKKAFDSVPRPTL